MNWHVSRHPLILQQTTRLEDEMPVWFQKTPACEKFHVWKYWFNSLKFTRRSLSGSHSGTVKACDRKTSKQDSLFYHILAPPVENIFFTFSDILSIFWEWLRRGLEFHCHKRPPSTIWLRRSPRALCHPISWPICLPSSSPLEGGRPQWGAELWIMRDLILLLIPSLLIYIMNICTVYVAHKMCQ